MSVTQRLMKPGSFRVELVTEYPLSLVSQIDNFDHIVITNTRLSPVSGFSDADILSAAAFTGVITKKASPRIFEGYDLAYWLGTPNGLGDVLDTAVSNAAASTLSTWVTSIRPTSLSAGTVTNAGTTTGTLGPYQWVTRREALDAVCKSMGAEWRVNPNFTLDAAISSTLFVATPTVIVTRNADGQEGAYRGMDGSLIVTASDVEQYTTKAICIAQGAGATIATGSSSSGATTYKDGLNNTVVMERLVNSPTEPSANAATVAAAVLGQFSSARYETSLSSRTYSVTRFVKPGDSVYVWDQLAGLTDAANQIAYRGTTITPTKLRVMGLTWPLEQGMGVYARRSGATPTYTDLTDYVQWETGDVQWEVGSATAALSNDTAASGSVARLGDNPDIAARTAAQGALTTWTPVVVQGATPTVTVSSAVYTRTGRWVTFEANLQITSAGTAANIITVSLPVTAAARYSSFQVIGNGILQDITGATSDYSGPLVTNSTTTCAISATTGSAGSAANNPRLGIHVFTGALASGDFIKVSGSYEAASD